MGPSNNHDLGPYKYDATNPLGCNAYAPGAFTGQIALVRRGACDFAVKVNNAAAAGAIARRRRP